MLPMVYARIPERLFVLDRALNWKLPEVVMFALAFSLSAGFMLMIARLVVAALLSFTAYQLLHLGKKLWCAGSVILLGFVLLSPLMYSAPGFWGVLVAATPVLTALLYLMALRQAVHLWAELGLFKEQRYESRDRSGLA